MTSTSRDGGLEDRLRGLILTNAETTSKPDSASIDGTARRVPEHLLGASIAGQEAHLRKVREIELLPKRPAQLPQVGRKRPNQAQRRQMNSETPMLPGPGRGTQVQGQAGHGFFPSRGLDSPAAQHHPNNDRNMPAHRSYQNSSYSAQRPMYMQQQTGAAQPSQIQHSDRGTYEQGHPNNRGYHTPNQFREPPSFHSRQLYQPGPYRSQGRAHLEFSQEQMALQSGFFEALLAHVVPEISMSNQESQEKETFRTIIEKICRDVIVDHERSLLGNLNFSSNFVELKCFGSMASGFATKMSDVDLALLTSHVQPSLASSESPIPRLLEKKFLELGYGARLLTKTRVPIIKLCQKPTATLLFDLTEEREKWEKDANDEKEVEYDHGSTGKRPKSPKSPQKIGAVGQKSVAEKPIKLSNDDYHKKVETLQQQPSQTLGDYCHSAKRLLQGVKGRDITANSKSLTDWETTILNEICKTFVIGLSDQNLSKRLLAYNSLSFPTGGPTRNQRSLAGVILQAYGEQINMAWNSRPLQESTRSGDVAHARALKVWEDLLNRTDMEVLAYDHALQLALARLRRIPSLQLSFLEQSLHEDPVAYRARVSRIMEEIKGEDRLETRNDDHILQIVLAHYINGVRPIKNREALQEMTTGTQKIPLQQILLEHRKLQLANDYESALEKKIYSEEDLVEIKRYINLLRKGSHTLNRRASPTPLIKKIRSLPDPTKGRDKYKDHLQFPKATVGIQCDINFSAELGLHNTLLLRCYSLCDPRVKQIVLFVKHWAKTRNINTPYTGTLSSYGYVLMVLHYLVNIAYPFVLPNLQQCRPDSSPGLSPSETSAQSICSGYDVRFWRNEEEIESLARQGRINPNHDSVGKLLCGFYEYYAQMGPMSGGGRGFDWGRDVLSLRTPGGLLTKQEKGWTCAKTVIQRSIETGPAPVPTHSGGNGDSSEAGAAPLSPTQKVNTREETKEIRHRYLFSIEDPFELDHNVARTVTHNGIVNIRDEFRRAWRIIKIIGRQGEEIEGGLLDPVMIGEREKRKSNWEEMMELLHGHIGAPNSWN